MCDATSIYQMVQVPNIALLCSEKQTKNAFACARDSVGAKAVRVISQYLTLGT